MTGVRRWAAGAVAFVVLLLAPGTATGASLYASNFGMGTISPFSVLGDGTLSPIACPGSSCNADLHTEGVAITPDGRYLYAADAGASSISVFSVAADGTLTPVTCSTCGTGAFPEQIGITPDGHFLYVTAASAGAVSPFSINTDGTLTPIACPTNCADLNAGSLAISPNGQFLYTASSGTGNISLFSIGSDGSLTPETCANCSAGSVTGNIAITPDGHFLYEAQYVTGGLIVPYAINTDGTLTQISCPANCLGGDHPRGIAITPDGRFLYVTNQTGNTVSPFSIDADGTLTPIACTGGSCLSGLGPVNAVVDPGGRWLYTANISGNSISPFSLAADGKLTPLVCLAPACETGSQPLGLVARPDQGPTASFTSTPALVAHPTSFDASGSTADAGRTVARYDWDFGDGTTLANGGVDPSHTYAAPGNYTVTLTIADDDGCSTARIYTGQTVSCNGSARARVTHQVVITSRHTLTVTVKGPGSISGPGIACPGDCSETYADGASVTLAASPTKGASFVGWGGDCTGDGACNMTLSADRAVTASFEAPPPPRRAPNTKLTNSLIRKHWPGSRSARPASRAGSSARWCASRSTRARRSSGAHHRRPTRISRSGSTRSRCAQSGPAGPTTRRRRSPSGFTDCGP